MNCHEWIREGDGMMKLFYHKCLNDCSGSQITACGEILGFTKFLFLFLLSDCSMPTMCGRDVSVIKYSTAPRCNALNYTAQHWVVLCCSVQEYTEMHCTSLNCTALHCTVLYCTVLHRSALQWTLPHYIALHNSMLNWVALYYTALHSTVLRCHRCFVAK